MTVSLSTSVWARTSMMVDRSAIAVIGISCRVPGAAGPAAFWRLLKDGLDAVAGPSQERRALVAGLTVSGGVFEDDPLAVQGGFLDRIDLFDAAFFGISPREAAAMDPQQRLMLELGWEAFEDAGVPPGELEDNQAGVFVGAISSDYADLLQLSGEQAVTRHALTGLHRGMIANRVSYTLGLRGPSMTVDTAQSSSLVAVHLACESLRRGESELALAGGVHLNISPNSALASVRFGGLSPDGRCFTFDARANGYVRGRAAAWSLLKPLSDRARRRRPRVLRDPWQRGQQRRWRRRAHGARAASPGRSPATCLPQSGRQARRRPVRGAARHWHQAGRPDRGDGARRGAWSRPAGRRPLLVGSVKTNIGHLEGAAGIVGLIKTALCHRAPGDPAKPQFPVAQPGHPSRCAASERSANAR